MKDKKKKPEKEMYEKILRTYSGADTDEFAADELEIGKSKYFSTCDFTMINPDEDEIDCQGS